MSETYGPKPSESFASYDPDTHSWRTYQVSFLTNTLAPYSESWPKQGTMRSGAVSRRPRSVPATNENDSSSWPTPDTMGARDGSQTRAAAYGNHAVSLHHKVAFWPTPQGDESGRSPEAWEQAQQAKAQVGVKLQKSLQVEAVNWPTPNAGPQNDSDTKWKERRQRIKAEKRNGNGFGLTLGMAVSEWWPTPTTRDYKDGTSAETVPEKGALGRVAPNRVNSDRWPSLQAPTTSTPGHECSPKCRRLNPLFVEWLQGFEIGHTALQPSETP